MHRAVPLKKRGNNKRIVRLFGLSRTEKSATIPVFQHSSGFPRESFQSGLIPKGSIEQVQDPGQLSTCLPVSALAKRFSVSFARCFFPRCPRESGVSGATRSSQGRAERLRCGRAMSLSAHLPGTQSKSRKSLAEKPAPRAETTPALLAERPMAEVRKGGRLRRAEHCQERPALQGRG